MKTLALRPPAERNETFSATAFAMAITPAAAEKDFWLCWVLMQLFDTPELSTCLRFKGGTSLSKCFNLIQRFSEDIDLILDWTQVIAIDPLTQRSKSQQDKLNQDINQKAQAYIAREILPKLAAVMSPLCQLEIDPHDPHTINIKYPAVFATGYLRPQIRIEIGPLAAMMPMGIYAVTPYAAEKFPQLFERPSVQVSAITPERTFWEKLTILHAEVHRPQNKLLPSRYSRHYYDSYKLANSSFADDALRNTALLQQVVEFKQRFYPSSWANYQTACVGSFKLVPNEHHLKTLQQDYSAMEEMIFGEHPNFDELMQFLAALEQKINHMT
ncbi:MAG TPA: nucleotidyl transferase AbiEii/AbiGii toxin family protein [Cellvibrio sp.]|nr:nucleotidyl transferase AbiEii/AbiGii toxin family protein [Cellvibrio sp.]